MQLMKSAARLISTKELVPQARLTWEERSGQIPFVLHTQQWTPNEVGVHIIGTRSEKAGLPLKHPALSYQNVKKGNHAP